MLSLCAGPLLMSVADSHAARADESPADALVGTLVETEEDIRVKSTDLVKTLLERSELNRDKYRKELQDKYCYRQAEDGVGDCAGLRLIPGATKRGLQKRPGWLNGLFGLKDDEEGAAE